jgi:hypothetical protein
LYPNLETEQLRRGHTDDYVAEALGMMVQEYQARKASKTVGMREAVALAGMYEMSTEYLFRSGV